MICGVSNKAVKTLHNSLRTLQNVQFIFEWKQVKMSKNNDFVVIHIHFGIFSTYDQKLPNSNVW